VQRVHEVVDDELGAGENRKTSVRYTLPLHSGQAKVWSRAMAARSRGTLRLPHSGQPANVQDGTPPAYSWKRNQLKVSISFGPKTGPSSTKRRPGPNWQAPRCCCGT
jgi:hypothetical protein